LLARLRSERGPGRSSRGARFWRELFADLESASREDDISWEVVFAVTEAVQAEVWPHGKASCGNESQTRRRPAGTRGYALFPGFNAWSE